MNWGIGIDIGGTQIKAIAVGQDGSLLQQESLPTNDREGALGEWIAQVKSIVSDFEAKVQSGVTGVGICSPGLAARDNRSIAYLPGKLEELEGFDWTEALGREKMVPVVNDAHAALLGEAWVGAAAGKQEVALFTLGTGVGGAILSGGQLLKGAIGRAGHLGHMSLDPNGMVSICNMPGAMETMVGDYTISERTNGQFSSTKDLVQAFESGDNEAKTFWLRSIRALGCAIGSAINILDPEIILLAGGITSAEDSLINPLKEVLEEVEWRPGGHSVPIEFASLGEWAGATGAAKAGLVS